MKKLISAMLALLMLASAAMANPGPPPRRGGPGPGRGPAMRPAPPRPGPRPGVQRPPRPAPRPGVQRPPRHMPPRPGIQRPPRPRPGGPPPGINRPPRPMPPRPGTRPGGPPPRPMPPRPPHHPGIGPRPPIRPGHHLPPPPPPPPRYYHRYHHWHDDWFFGGLGIGLIIGALSNSGSSDYSAQRDYERRAEEVRRAARETADQQSRHLVEIISRIGSQSALYELNEYWQAQGQTTSLDTSDPIRSLRVSGFQENLTIVYWLDRSAREETVTVTAPAYNVSESASSRYTEPPGTEAPLELRQQQPAPPAPEPPLPPETASAFKRLGFTLDENARTPQGHLIIQSVTPSTVAAYTGMTKGATLYKIDGNTTAQVSVEQLCAFIERRAAAGASVKVTFSDKGKEKTVSMQL